MSLESPQPAQIKSILAELGLNFTDEQILDYLTAMQSSVRDYEFVDSCEEDLLPIKYQRDQGYFPTNEENPLNGWYVKTDINGANDGLLRGKTVAIKDNVCVADIPMMNGSSTLMGYVPEIDATVVTRILDAGATITGKAHCEYFCASGGSHTTATGPVHNPHRRGYSAGGSSSGCGALVGAGAVDMAIGGDQGGSVRIPASYSGCYGLKPTHGLVPYTGAMPMDNTIDHLGPMTQNALDNARLLQAIAGEDGLDPRQHCPQVGSYVSAIGSDVNGISVGILKEGFGWSSSEPDVDSKVRVAAKQLQKLGISVEEVSVPLHRKGYAIWTPIGLEGFTNQMMFGNGMGTGWEGLHITSLLDYHSKWRTQVDKLDPTVIVSILVGQYYRKYHDGRYYAKAQNLRRQLRSEYDRALSRFDLLLMPTTPMKATPLPLDSDSVSLRCHRAFESGPNTCPTDLTGHPAMSIPCGMSQGLPVGMMLVAQKWKESTIYAVASAFEQANDWQNL